MSLVEVGVDRRVCTITLADDARRNALSADLLAELTEAIDGAEADSDVRVIVLTNRGNTFCAGANLAERRDSASASQPANGLVELFERIRQSPKPFVGRIGGHCVAGGVGLAAVMDVSIAAADATFGFSEVRLGLAPAIIAVVCLPKMRHGDAQEAFLRATRFDAARAQALGLISHAVARDELDDAVRATVDDLLLGEPGAIAAIKRLVRVVPTLDAEAAFAWTAGLSSELFASDAAREGMTAFLEKRRPAWAPQLDE